MKKLLIVESPAKIKTISKFLGKDFRIMSTVGHIKDLPQRKLGVMIDNNEHIVIDYVVSPGKEKVIADIVKTARGCEAIFLAPDPDREGEIIAWHIGQEIEKVADPQKIHRITFNEITKEAILAAVKKSDSVDLQKVAAQQARRVLDRWVGYEVSPLLWRKIAKGLSAGRVQSVALRMICEREEAIKAFVPEEYWSVEGDFTHKKETFSATLYHINKKKADLKNKEQTDKVVADIKKTAFHISKIEDKKRLKNPLPPFMTSTLQQAAYNRLNFSVKKTMQLAQNLYEGVTLDDPNSPQALITYMRTDSLRISDTAIKAAREFINTTFGKPYLLPSAKQYTKKGGAQDAHEAIRPIDVSITPEFVAKYLPKDQAHLYELIWRRFVACQMKAAQYAQRTVSLQGGIYTFRVTGSTLLFDGFLKVYKIEDEEDKKKISIPGDLKEKDTVDLKKVSPKQHFTQPPPRFTEATLVKSLEKEGIGRPSTYATILGTIRARSYTELDEKKRFTPTELGFAVTKLLVKHFPQIMDLRFTAHMEEDLDKISQGEIDRDKLLLSFYKNFEKDLKKFAETARENKETSISCPSCDKHKLFVRFGKSGEFLGCGGFPECSFTSNFTRNDDGTLVLQQGEAPKELEEICPKCKKHKMREMMGRYGKFVACSGYPECKYIKQETADVSCPECKKKTPLVKRKWSKGSFWGCTNYPKCKFTVFGDIETTQCPECKNPFLAKRELKSGTIIECPKKSCGYKKQGV